MTRFTRRAFAQLAASAAAAAAVPRFARAEENWRIGFRTAPETLDAELARRDGRLPAGLAGSFYRIGPAQFERAGERLGHWFDGDGMIQRFAIADGRVVHRGRFVDTPKRRAEKAAGRFLYTGYGFAPKNLTGIRAPDDLNAANTNVLPVAGEVWALWEGGSPYRVDAETLATRGRKAFDGELNGVAFSAHPKREPGGDTWNFGVIGRRCVLWHLARDGGLRRAKLIELPEASLMHDFAITARHLVLLAPPMLAHDGPANALVDRYAWRADKPLTAFVLDKSTFEIVRRYELPSRFLYHIGNAWEDADGTIRLDACLDADATFAVKTARELALGLAQTPLTARPSLITLPPSGAGSIEPLEGVGEFPRVDPRRVGRRHRFTHGVVEGGVATWDWEKGVAETYRHPPGTWSEEPVFVPRKDATGERDGWLVQTALDLRAGRTTLCIFDARRTGDGPIARFAFPYALPLGFHGTFVE